MCITKECSEFLIQKSTAEPRQLRQNLPNAFIGNRIVYYYFIAHLKWCPGIPLNQEFVTFKAWKHSHPFLSHSQDTGL
jgi:hypothetical protein